MSYQVLQGRPFAEWNDMGRMVRAGQKADHYLVSPDGEKFLALFREDQTEILVPFDITGWSEVITAEQRRARREKVPMVRVRPYGIDGAAVWCGNNEISLLVKDDWSVFSMGRDGYESLFKKESIKK